MENVWLAGGVCLLENGWRGGWSWWPAGEWVELVSYCIMDGGLLENGWLAGWNW